MILEALLTIKFDLEITELKFFYVDSKFRCAIEKNEVFPYLLWLTEYFKKDVEHKLTIEQMMQDFPDKAQDVSSLDGHMKPSYAWTILKQDE
jgi:hypothetical protein